MDGAMGGQDWCQVGSFGFPRLRRVRTSQTRRQGCCRPSDQLVVCWLGPEQKVSGCLLAACSLPGSMVLNQRGALFGRCWLLQRGVFVCFLATDWLTRWRRMGRTAVGPIGAFRVEKERLLPHLLASGWLALELW